MHWLPLAADGRTVSHEATLRVDPHATGGRGLAEHGNVLPPRRRDAQKWTPIRRGCEPRVVGMQFLAGALTSTTGAYPAAWEGAA